MNRFSSVRNIYKKAVVFGFWRSEGKGFFDFIHIIQTLPGEESDGAFALCSFHFSVVAVTAEMPVGGGGLVDRVFQLEAGDDVIGAHREDLADAHGDLAVVHLHLGGAVSVDIQSHGFRFADGVGHLDEHLVAEAGGHHVLGDVAGGVGG